MAKGKTKETDNILGVNWKTVFPYEDNYDSLP